MPELTDENFEEVIKKSDRPVLVDFWAKWCFPCSILTPILEKLTKDYQEKFILAKVNIDEAPLVAQKYKIEKIPFVIFFRNGKPISGFIGVRPEPIIKEWLDGILRKDTFSASEKSDKLIKECQEYAARNGYKLNPNKEVVRRLIEGLLENEKKYAQRYCPCRRVTGNQEEDQPKICPCQWHHQEIEKNGHCLCGLFVKERVVDKPNF